MITPPGDRSAASEHFLSAAYTRILRVAAVLSAVMILLTMALFDWANGAVLALGACLGCLNFVWLHHGANLVVGRMIQGESGPASQRVAFAFIARYLVVLTVAYVILKSYPRTRVAFMVGLACPIVAAMCEGFYEAVAGKTDQT
jgi:ATP synthase I chain